MQCRSSLLAWAIAIFLLAITGCSAASFDVPSMPGASADADAADTSSASDGATTIVPSDDATASSNDSRDESPAIDSLQGDGDSALPSCTDGECLHWPGPTCVEFASCWGKCRDLDAGACVLLAGTTDSCACEGIR